MAKPILPDALTRRHWIEGELSPERCKEVAEAYLEEGRRAEAVAFLAKGGLSAELEALRDDAVAAGDAFLLRATAAALDQEPGAERWAALAENARAAGKEAYAHDAERQVGRREGD